MSYALVMSSIVVAGAIFFVGGVLMGAAVWACVNIARDLVLDGDEDGDDDDSSSSEVSHSGSPKVSQ
jgi:hypothetical protein